MKPLQLLSSGNLRGVVLDVTVVAALIIIEVGLVHAGLLPGLRGGEIGELTDPDAYARLLRVLQLWEGGGWFNANLYAIHPPAGAPMHWSRPLDVLTLAAAIPLSMATGSSMREAAFQVALYAPLISLAIIAVTLRRMAFPRTGAIGSLLVVPAFAGSWSLLGSLRVGILDHQLIMLPAFLGVLALKGLNRSRGSLLRQVSRSSY